MTAHMPTRLQLAAIGTAAAVTFGCSPLSTPAMPGPSGAPSTTPAGGTAGACPRAAVDYRMDVDSAALGGSDRVAVHLTPCTAAIPGPLPVLYLLHGAGADESQWIDIGMLDAVDAAVAHGTFPAAVIAIPDAAPVYSGSVDADLLATYLLDDVEPALAATVDVDPHRRAIGGISRGGGFALDVVGDRPDAFLGVAGHSSVSVPDQVLDTIATAGLPVRLDVGSADPLAASTRQMGDRLAADGGDVDVIEAAGDHDRAYWRVHTADYATFYGAVLTDPPSGSEVATHG